MRNSFFIMLFTISRISRYRQQYTFGFNEEFKKSKNIEAHFGTKKEISELFTKYSIVEGRYGR